MKILMFHGRAGGHNIMPFLEYFNNSEEYDLTFIYSNDRTFYPPKNRIRFVKFSFSPLQFLKALSVIRKDYDLIWYHGGHSAFIFYIFSILRNPNTLFIFNVWNEWLIQKAKVGDRKGKMFQYGIRHADAIHCNWHGTAEVLQETGWNNNIKVFYWGLPPEYFDTTEKPLQEETNRFIAQLPKNKTKFFFPKSISPNSRHDLVIDAAEQLLSEGITDFIVYFWMGNTNRPELIEEYRQKIEELGVQEHVILQRHGFLPFSDMKFIWKNMDVGLQIAANEQLSTTFLEPMFFKKPSITTDIRPYRIFQEKFGKDLVQLIPLNSTFLAEEMKLQISDHAPNIRLLEKRHDIVKENFNFYQNIGKILTHYGTPKADN